ncbi:hypothetical protein QMK17_21590 [Rhodococcus sp. G-MC3]|uniref:hypothetical protein n=1 Tax=Rhodococcus sp. G-MC3 TaxID=3046209 RepID=UPI0024BAFD9C|nr:hypothetical protein [Rhodococcus sp. G-MC3]MDJ0395916.1 hypothetical protein [Rhodococcus sp. G-MC3]
MPSKKVFVQLVDDVDHTVIDGECSTFYYKFGGEVCVLDLNAENSTLFLKFLMAANRVQGTKKQLKKLLKQSMIASTQAADLDMTPNGFESVLDELIWDVVEAKIRLEDGGQQDHGIYVANEHYGANIPMPDYDDNDFDEDAWRDDFNQQWSKHVDGPAQKMDDVHSIEYYSRLLSLL